MDLLRVRKLLNLTQVQLAKKTGYKQCHISLMEKGIRTLTPKFAKKMQKLIVKMRGNEARLEKYERTNKTNSKW